MKKKVLLSLIILSSLVLSGCLSFDPLTLLKANSQVKSFLDEYPDADVTMVKLVAANIADENAFVQELCGVSLEEKDYYKVTMNDAASNLEIYAYVDIASQEVICLKKIGKEVAKNIEREAYPEKYEYEYKEEYTDDDGYEYKEEYKYEYEHKEEYDEEDCKREVELWGKVRTEYNDVVLEWSPYTCRDFEGYKVVWSNKVDWPKYPDQGYIKFITDAQNTRIEDELRGELIFYSITVLTKNGKVYSEPIKLVSENYGIPRYDCEETDNGRDYFVAGKAYSQGVKFYDECKDDNTLVESFCSDGYGDDLGYVKKEEHVCEHGCVEGKCRKEADTFCFDSDAGKDFFSEGYVVDNAEHLEKQYDSCHEGEVLVEYYCYEGIIHSKEYVCDEGHSCVEGACVKSTAVVNDSFVENEYFLVVNDVVVFKEHNITLFDILGDDAVVIGVDGGENITILVYEDGAVGDIGIYVNSIELNQEHNTTSAKITLN